MARQTPARPRSLPESGNGRSPDRSLIGPLKALERAEPGRVLLCSPPPRSMRAVPPGPDACSRPGQRDHQIPASPASKNTGLTARANKGSLLVNEDSSPRSSQRDLSFHQSIASLSVNNDEYNIPNHGYIVSDEKEKSKRGSDPSDKMSPVCKNALLNDARA